MALGFSGSNGGIRLQAAQRIESTSPIISGGTIPNFRGTFPLEVSYFVNSICNLHCRHCYVGYRADTSSHLNLDQWISILADFVGLGALTFGNVGKEPLLSPEKTFGITGFLKQLQTLNPRIRYGLVTNGTLINQNNRRSLEESGVTWLDLSFDGTEQAHDRIRGSGNFARSFANASNLSGPMKHKMFILFTATKVNVNDFVDMAMRFAGIGIRQFMISPFVATHNENAVGNESLALDEHELLNWLEGLMTDSRLEGCNIYVKSDYQTTHAPMESYLGRGFIRRDMLMMDDYGVIFDHHKTNTGCQMFFNYMPFDDTYIRQLRITEDGLVGQCLDMFFQRDPTRFVGDLKNERAREIMERLIPKT